MLGKAVLFKPYMAKFNEIELAYIVGAKNFKISSKVDLFIPAYNCIMRSVQFDSNLEIPGSWCNKTNIEVDSNLVAT